MGFFEVFATALAGFYAVVSSYGLAIIVLTIAVRVLLLPLTIKQTRSQREMQRIMPEVKAIQKKHKGDRQKINEGTMALYKEHGVNPLGGCAPLLMQFPVLIGLYYVVRTPLAYMGFVKPDGNVPFAQWEMRGDIPGILERIQSSALADALRERTLEVHQFLGLRLDCSTSAALSGQDPSRVGATCGNGVVDALPYVVLIILMGLSTWYMQKQLQSSRGDAGGSEQMAQQMQMFTKIMPFMLMFFAYSFPTGVVIYWLTTNVWTIGQQQLVLRVVPHNPPAGSSPPDKGERGRTAKSPGGKPTPGKPARGAPSPGAGEDGQRSPTRASKPHPSSKKKKKR